MEEADKDAFITLDQTASDSLLSTSDLRNNSKRKASDSDLGCVIESTHVGKKLCHGVEDRPADSQIITVVFQSQDAARKYSKEIADYIAQLTKSEITTSVEREGKPCLEFYKNDDKPAKPDGAARPTYKQLASSPNALPQYEQTFTGAVGMQFKAKVKDANKAKPKNMCFNCEGDHMIAACPDPRDTARIAKNRRKHAEKNISYGRYHEEADQKYGHLQPGQISAGLREALGLRDAELPLHTYRMRVQGYPPGWLRSARLQRSNISVHHEPAPELDNNQSKVEEQEEEHYDLNKLISFPGFNVKCPDGCRDDFQRRGFPPLSRFWSLRVMRQRLRRAPAGRRAGLQRQRPADLPSTARNGPAQPPTQANGAGAGSEPTANGDREGSPSLEALEEQRRALLESLEEDGELEDDEEDDEEEEQDDGEPVELVHAPPVASSTPQTPVLTPGASRRRELGTPVTSRSAHLIYDAEKWSAGITEHIPYENLPGATGAWDRMSSLMKKVRDKLSGKN